MRRPNSHLQNNTYERQILQRVSRSFALTIPQLPPDLSRTVTNAYLLCRIVDTIEDEESLTIDQKRLFFQEFIDVVNCKAPADKFAANLYPLLGNKTLPAEKELIKNTPSIIHTLFSFNTKQQHVMIHCLKVMSKGMLKFQKIKSPHGLENLSQLSDYCFHVAGIVGEMLTELFCDYSEDIAKNREKLLERAASFGQGLQLINILKDVWEDKERGICWLPRDVFKNMGFDLKNLSIEKYTPSFGKGLTVLIGIAHSHLRNALNYALLMPRHETGIRKFSLWAIGMAVLTLQNINKTPNYTSGNDVKISRKSVKMVILASNVSLRSNAMLKAFFKLAGRNLPTDSSINEHFRPVTTSFVKDRSVEYQEKMN